MSDNILDKLTDQELREMIISQNINLEELGSSTLKRLLDYEIYLICLGKGNPDFVEQCTLYLDRSFKNATITDAQMTDIINETKEKHIVIIEDNNNSNRIVRPLYKRKFRKIAIIAAATLLFAITSSLVAVAFDINIREFLGSIVREDAGSKVDEGGFTFYNNGETKQYISVEELIEEERLFIMYPSEFPDDIKLESITVGTNHNGNCFLTFVTDDSYTNITIELNAKEYDSSSPTTYESNGIVYYIQEGEICVAYSYHNGNSYYICAQTKENLLLIIDKMKE